LAVSIAKNNPSASWHARLELEFQQQKQRTVIHRKKHTGPLLVQKPFYPEGRVCHLYIIHPPGGVVGGDSLELDISIGRDSHTLITTPSAGKFYRSDGRIASQTQHIRLHENAVLEWFPQENIYFNQSNVKQRTRIELSPSSRFIGWDIICLGRRAANESYTQGQLTQSLELVCNNKPLLIERSDLAAGDPALTALWGFQNFPVSGTFIACPVDKGILDKVRDLAETEGLFSATLMGNNLLCRYLGNEAEIARKKFIQVWNLVRPALLKRKTCEPRIWQT